MSSLLASSWRALLVALCILSLPACADWPCPGPAAIEARRAREQARAAQGLPPEETQASSKKEWRPPK
jgi:hypothetical protein